MNGHHFEIEPLKGVGPIRFGMSKDDVSGAFTYVYTSFFKVPGKKVRSDHCEVVGLIVHYDEAARVNFIEVHEAQQATVSLELFGLDVTGISVRGLVELLEAQGVQGEKTDYGYDFPSLGLSTFNSQLESDDDAVECIGVGPESAA